MGVAFSLEITRTVKADDQKDPTGSAGLIFKPSRRHVTISKLPQFIYSTFLLSGRSMLVTLISKARVIFEDQGNDVIAKSKMFS